MTKELKIAIVIYGKGYPYAVGGAEIFAYRLAHELTKYRDIDNVLLLQGGLCNNTKYIQKGKLSILYLPLKTFRGLRKPLLLTKYNEHLKGFNPDVVLGISIGSIIPLAPILFSARKPIAIRFAGLDLCLLYNLKTMNNRVVEDEILHRYCSRVLGYLHRLKQRIALGIVEKIIKFCAKTGKCYIVTLSNTMRKLVELLNYSMSKITLTIPNFVDDIFFTVASKRFSCTTNYDRRKDRRKIMITYLGRLEYEKGADILAKIVKNVLDVCNNCLFKIVGDGRYRWMFENIRIRYGSRLIVTGFIPYNRVPQHLLESDIFVFPTRVEGSPNALLQAMASGLPIVASDIPPNREFLGEAGLYATPEKPEEFVHHILELASNPDLRIRLGKKANERAKMYSRKVIVQRYISLFRFLTRC